MTTRILTAGVLIPLVLGSLFWGPRWLFLLLGSVFLAGAIWEYLQVIPSFGASRLPISYPLILGLPWIWNYLPQYRIPYLLLAGLLLLASGLATRGEPKSIFLSSSMGLLGLFYLGIPFALIGTLHPGTAATVSGYELLLVLASVWICDSAAYFAGRSLGKHRITPTISPGKTLEGFAAAIIFGGSFVVLAGTLYLGWSAALSVCLALVLPLATIYGDLFESVLKRGAGIKDSSNLIPGHGGVLDRIDSLLFALPSYFVVTSLVG